MANQKRKPANAQPISAHPLFPAVVALWFGALFGLGSLAVRPSLLENLVLQSHIDLVIPAAAPPLGITARILLALVLAALGAILGIMLSRRLARPTTELHERKRGAKDLAVQTPHIRSRDAHPDAPARRPISAHEELGGEPVLASEQAPAIGPGMLATRRRGLAMIEEERVFVPQEFAPLPGGAEIQPLDLATLALPENPPALAAPVATAPLPAAAPAPLAQLPASTIEPISAEAVHRDGRQVFGMSPPEPQTQAPRQIFGVVAEGDHLPQNFVKAAVAEASVSETSAASPLFVCPEPEAARQPAETAIASAAEPLPSPATLGMTELAARLTESMRRRRERVQPPVAAVPEPGATADIIPALAAEERATTPILAQLAATTPAPVQPDFSPPSVAMPAAMRPLALDAFVVDDAVFDPGLLPPRHIAMPPPVTASVTVTVPTPLVMADPAADQADGDPAEHETPAADSADDPYASLLGLAPQRTAFVRIDEPSTAPHEAPEPVVIFPGQAPQMPPLVAAAPAPSDDNTFRRFDAPSSAGHGQPIAAMSSTATVDPAEAEQALRAALNNLQRMSGAA